MQSYKTLRDIKSDRVKYIFNNDVMGDDFLGKGQFGSVFRGYHYN
jgi:hypothetical protein